MRALIILIVVILGVGCANKSPNLDCTHVAFNPVFALRMENSDEVFYEHFILVDNYDEKCFPWVDFSVAAKNYTDTCKSHKPAKIITFLKSNEGNGFEENELDFDRIYQNELIGFEIESSMISDVIIVNGGRKKYIKIKNCKWEENSTFR